MEIEILNSSKRPSASIVMRMVKFEAGFGTNAFLISQTPVTIAQWKDLVEDTFEANATLPMVNVDWIEASAFCDRCGLGMRLPTELEWCRAAGLEPLVLAEHAVFGKRSLPDVATKKPNEFNLYDMRGLVWEWLMDKESELRVLRGGSWAGNERYAKGLYRNLRHPHYKDEETGFRVVRSL